MDIEECLGPDGGGERGRGLRVRTVKHLLDNEAVVKQFKSVSKWSALRWVKATDRDLWRLSVSKRFKQLLVTEAGLKPEQARDLLRGIRAAAHKGTQTVWEARSKARAAIVKGERVAFEKELEAAVQKAEAKGQDWCVGSGIDDIRGHVMRMTRNFIQHTKNVAMNIFGMPIVEKPEE